MAVVNKAEHKATGCTARFCKVARNFLSVYHTTPKKYYNQRRMNLALEKLLGGAKVKNVAEELGFSTSYAFSKAFKAHFGLSPEKYVTSLNKEIQNNFLPNK